MSVRLQSDYQRALGNRDLLNLRRVLMEMIVRDPRDVSGHVHQMLQGILDQAPEAFDTHDGEVWPPAEEWDMRHYEMVQARLNVNFSRERVCHLLDVGPMAYQRNATNGVKERRDGSTGRWVSIAFVVGLSLLGLFLVFGPPQLRFLFSNWGGG